MLYDMNSGNPHNIGEILESMDEIMLFHMMLNDKAMKCCHAWGYNGFKRMHRYNDRCFLEYHIQLSNEAYDKYKMTLETKHKDFDYMPSDLMDHLKKWEMKLGEDIKMLGKLNNEYRMMTGNGNCVAEDAMYIMCRNYEKSGRYYKRFMETKSAHDMHEMDDAIHSKYKAKEEAKGYNY